MESALLDFAPMFESLKAAKVGEIEAEWTKVRGLEFREALGERDTLFKELEFFTVTGEDEFEELVS